MLTGVKGEAVLAFDGRGHRLLRNGIVVFEGNTITYVGAGYPGRLDAVVDTGRCLVLPGFVNIHTHGGAEPGGRLILDCGRADAFNTGYMNVQTTRPGRRHIGQREDPALGARQYLAECVRHGSTTVVNVGQGGRELIAAAREIGVRLYAGPRYAGAVYVEETPGRIEYRWDEARGEAGLREACEFAAEAARDGGGLVTGMLCPHAADTCGEALLAATMRAADDLGVRVQIHAAQGLFEFTEMVRRTQLTPIRWLHARGVLGPRTILGHAIFLDHHPLAPAPGRIDLDLLAASGAHVAHCPLALARRGWALHSFDRYRRAGVNVAIGTDTCPRDIVDEMRWASYVCKLVEGDFTAGQPADVINAATLGAAAALGRDDLGRLAPGARADIAAYRLDQVRVGPVLDPVRSLIHYAAGGPAAHVWVDGRRVVESGAVAGVDEARLSGDVQRMGERLWADVPEWEGSGRTAEQMCPPAFPLLDQIEPVDHVEPGSR
ncbi:MAG TPA: chlorohydrolase family protein [bacterium]|nr:chlorohydrolase family protein [bacterium]